MKTHKKKLTMRRRSPDSLKGRGAPCRSSKEPSWKSERDAKAKGRRDTYDQMDRSFHSGQEVS